MENINEFLVKKQKEKENKISLSEIKKSLDIALGKSINSISSFKKGRLDQVDIDYSLKDHHNVGHSTRNKTLLAAGMGSILYTLNMVGFKAESFVNFSNENVVSMIDKFKEQNIAEQGLLEITQFIGNNIINNPDLLPIAVNMTIAAGIFANGLYHKNSLKRSNYIEEICKYADERTNSNSRITNAKKVFLELDFHYEYKRMFYKAGENTVQFLKDISAPVLQGIKNNITHPILNQIKSTFGESLYNKVGESVSNMTPEFIKDFFNKEDKITSKDMILLMDRKVKESKIMESTNNPKDLDMQKEISRIAQDVYETIQLAQLRKTLILATADYVQYQKRIKEEQENNSGFLSNRKIKKLKKESEKSLEHIYKIGELAEYDAKKNRISRFSILSSVAMIVLEDLDNFNATDYKRDLKKLALSIGYTLRKEEAKFKSILGNNEYYAQDLEKALMPKSKSFEHLFKNKVDEFIKIQEQELENKRKDSLKRVMDKK